jgi:hypothetical protein
MTITRHASERRVIRRNLALRREALAARPGAWQGVAREGAFFIGLQGFFTNAAIGDR